MSWDHAEIRDLIARALAEDVGAGDATTNACVPAEQQASGFFLSRQAMTVAGTPLLPLIYDQEELEILCEDGSVIDDETVFARVRGSARRLLTLERTALNFLQRASGIATNAARYVQAVEGTSAKILDTRKTIPGLRRLEKLAVAVGGATNHRFGLWDAVLIKNNHIDAAGGVAQALERCRDSGLPVEIEVRNVDELDEALAAGADHVMLDNFSPEQVADAVRRIDGRARVEVSGGITLETIRAYAEAGPDFISVGALTHSAPAADISFRIESA